MGGRALALVTRRYNKDEFYKLADELIPEIELLFNTEVHLIGTYREKETFGDMDLLVKYEGERPNFKEKVLNRFSIKMDFNNNGVYSFDYKELQIDLIATKAENWEIAKVFFGMSDLGNFMGKLYHKFGLKYGFDGLVYPYRIDGKKMANIKVSKDPDKIFSFLGLSFDEWCQGFDTIEDVFAYVTKSKYFDPEAFSFKNLNAINKRRNKKRDNYNYFIKWLDEYNVKPNSSWKFEEDKTKYWEMIDEYFPGFIKEIKKAQYEEEKRLKAKEKFNGWILINDYNLSPKECGLVIAKFKERFNNNQEYIDYIFNSTEDTIFKEIEKIIDIEVN
jgi:hypothetical protein